MPIPVEKILEAFERVSYQSEVPYPISIADNKYLQDGQKPKTVWEFYISVQASALKEATQLICEQFNRADAPRVHLYLSVPNPSATNLGKQMKFVFFNDDAIPAGMNFLNQLCEQFQQLTIGPDERMTEEELANYGKLPGVAANYITYRDTTSFRVLEDEEYDKLTANSPIFQTLHGVNIIKQSHYNQCVIEGRGHCPLRAEDLFKRNSLPPIDQNQDTAAESVNLIPESSVVSGNDSLSETLQTEISGHEQSTINPKEDSEIRESSTIEETSKKTKAEGSLGSENTSIETLSPTTNTEPATLVPSITGLERESETRAASTIIETSKVPQGSALYQHYLQMPRSSKATSVLTPEVINAIGKLKDTITKMKKHGEKIVEDSIPDSEDQAKGAGLKSLAGELETMLLDFEKEPSAEKYRTFSVNFKRSLKDKNEMLRFHRSPEGPAFLNLLLVALAGIGLLIIGVKSVYAAFTEEGITFNSAFVCGRTASEKIAFEAEDELEELGQAICPR